MSVMLLQYLLIVRHVHVILVNCTEKSLLSRMMKLMFFFKNKPSFNIFLKLRKQCNLISTQCYGFLIFFFVLF